MDLDYPKITLAAARVNAGLSQKDAAKKLKISSATLGNWENGKALPSLSDLMALGELYQFPYSYFFVREVAKNASD